MAEVIQRIWRSGPRKVRRAAWGYTLQVNGRQVRVTNTRWTEQDAERVLAARLLEQDAASTPSRRLTFGEAIDRYLEVKAPKRSIRDDEAHLARLRGAFGAETPLTEITAARVADYKVARLRTMVKREGADRPIEPATLNRELAALRHLVRLAVDEWEVLDRAPRIRLEKEPEGRIRWLELDEERRLLEACAVSQNRSLAGIVLMAMETGMRAGEISGLTWERVDLTRGVFRLERTKGGRRREVPMRQSVYGLLAAMPEPRTGALWPRTQIRKAFETAVGRAGLEDFTFHDLRHHVASWFIMRGGRLEALREILGHRDIKMTLRYAHLAPGHLLGEVQRTAGPVTISTSSAQHATIDPQSARKSATRRGSSVAEQLIRNQ